jgi:hypothetical protein
VTEAYIFIYFAHKVTKVNLSVSLIKNHTSETYRVMEAQLQALLISALDACKWSASGSGFFTSRTQWIGGWVLPTADLNNLHRVTSAPTSIRTLITSTFAELSQEYLNISGLRSEFLMVMNMITSVFRKMTPSSLVERYITDVSAVPVIFIFKVEE